MKEESDIEKSLAKQEEKVRLERVLAILLEADLICLGKLLEKQKKEKENKCFDIDV